MRKLAVILIVVAVAVILGANWYIGTLPTPPAPTRSEARSPGMWWDSSI